MLDCSAVKHDIKRRLQRVINCVVKIVHESGAFERTRVECVDVCRIESEHRKQRELMDIPCVPLGTIPVSPFEAGGICDLSLSQRTIGETVSAQKREELVVREMAVLDSESQYLLRGAPFESIEQRYDQVKCRQRESHFFQSCRARRA